METKTTEFTTERKTEMKAEVKSFFTNDLLMIIKTIITEPINGTYSLFSKNETNRFFQSIILMLTTMALYFITALISVGSFRASIPFSIFLRAAIIPALFMLSVSLISFGIKSISGKVNFRKELFTGALCAIPLCFAVLFIIVLSFFDENMLGRMIQKPSQLFNGGIIVAVIFIYLFLMLINILQQSLKAADTKDSMAWYLAPLGVFAAFYLTSLISQNILF